MLKIFMFGLPVLIILNAFWLTLSYSRYALANEYVKSFSTAPSTGRRFSKYGRPEVPWIYFKQQKPQLDKSDHFDLFALPSQPGSFVKMHGVLELAGPTIWFVDDASHLRIAIESHPCEAGRSGELGLLHAQIAYRLNPFELVEEEKWIVDGKVKEPDLSKYVEGRRIEKNIRSSFGDAHRVTATAILCHYSLSRVGTPPDGYEQIVKPLQGSHLFFDARKVTLQIIHEY